MRAFDYSDSLGTRKNVRNTGYFLREKEIAWKYVNGHNRRNFPKCCSVCGSKHLKYLFQRWDVNYYFCEDCASIFTPVDAEVISGYLSLAQMMELRKSKEYQDDANIRRADIWDDMMRWLTYRIYRYMGKKEGLIIADYGDRFKGQIERIRTSGLCQIFILVDSILDGSVEWSSNEKVDILLYLNQLQHESNPQSALEKVSPMIKKGGLLIISTRLGSGFDILTLKDGLDNIFPYEHVMLPSKKGLELLLENAGFELLEFLTPGALDVKYVLDNIERVDESNLFVKQLLDVGDEKILMEFQRLLQKAGLSSFAQAIVRKK